LEAVYAAPAEPVKPPIDATLTIVPWPASLMVGSTAWHSRMTPVRLTPDVVVERGHRREVVHDARDVGEHVDATVRQLCGIPVDVGRNGHVGGEYPGLVAGVFDLSVAARPECHCVSIARSFARRSAFTFPEPKSTV
jgi:hypothetical protein